MATPPIRTRQSRAQNLRRLLKSHYLSDEFPGVLTTANFADFCAKNLAKLPTNDKLLSRITQYAPYSAPRLMEARRPLALPHPASQLALSRIIAENRADIADVINRSKLTLYNTRPDAGRDRFFVGVDFNARDVRKAEILARYPVVLMTDIANFFHTIYSHSLPWAVLGKQHVKDVLEPPIEKADKVALNQHWSSQIDKALQRGNSRETFGIPVGPDTSRMIAEILLSGIHSNQSLETILQDRAGYRLVDDFFIGFDDEVEAHRCRDILRRALWDYNLHFNETKTGLKRSSAFFDDSWKYEIDSFDIPKRNLQKQRDAIQRLMEIALEHCTARDEPIPASFFCQKLTRIEIMQGNFPFVRDCMLRMARDFTGCLKSVVIFTTQFRTLLNDGESKAVMRRWLKQIFATHTHRGHDMEIANALAICGVLGLRVDRDFIAPGNGAVSPVVLAMLGLLSEDGLLAEPWDDWRPKDSASSANIVNSRFWLPYYEAVLRKWTKDPDLVLAFAEDDFFTSLASESVSFLDMSDFASKIKPVPLPRGRPPKSGVLQRGPVSSVRRSVVDEYP
jgi:hypothetical protein